MPKCDKCGTKMERYDWNDYYCPNCSRHAYKVSDNSPWEFDDDNDADFMGNDDLDWDNILDD